MEKGSGSKPSDRQGFQMNKAGYFQNRGVNVMAFDDIYPEGHQSGVSLIRAQPRRLVVYSRRRHLGHGADSSRLSRAAGVSLPVAAGRICAGRRFFAFYVYRSGSTAANQREVIAFRSAH